VSAAELPALSSAVGDEQQVAAFLRQRLTAGLRRIAFFIVPSAVAFLVLGDVIAAALYQSGRFSHDDAVYLWGVLAGSSVGLLASSLGRLYSSAFYALLDTRTPLRFAVCRVAVTTVLGVVFALFLPHWLGINQKWGVAGLTVSAGIAGWVEFALLRHALTGRIGSVSLDAGFTVKLWLAAFVASAGGWFAKPLAGIDHPILRASLALPLYGCFYLAGTYLLRIPESRRVINAIPWPKSGR
jgi:putative peptidoglycan lipid II flippase